MNGEKEEGRKTFVRFSREQITRKFDEQKMSLMFGIDQRHKTSSEKTKDEQIC